MRSSRLHFLLLPMVICMASAPRLFAQEEPRLSEEQMKEFLLNAPVISSRNTTKGITSPFRLTMSDGKLTHDAAFQKVNEYKNVMIFPDGHREVDFKDCYKFDIAAYELGKMLGLGEMMPVTVERKWRGDTGALSWWLPVKMDEATRTRKKIEPLDTDAWNKQMYKKRIFAELVYDTDPNLTNILIGEDWTMWFIDFTRAFRKFTEIRDPRNIIETRCERHLFENLRKLDRNELASKTNKYLTKDEINGVMSRRDKIVKIYEGLIAQKGESAVLYEDPVIK